MKARKNKNRLCKICHKVRVKQKRNFYCKRCANKHRIELNEKYKFVKKARNESMRTFLPPKECRCCRTALPNHKSQYCSKCKGPSKKPLKSGNPYVAPTMVFNRVFTDEQ